MNKKQVHHYFTLKMKVLLIFVRVRDFQRSCVLRTLIYFFFLVDINSDMSLEEPLGGKPNTGFELEKIARKIKK